MSGPETFPAPGTPVSPAAGPAGWVQFVVGVLFPFAATALAGLLLAIRASLLGTDLLEDEILMAVLVFGGPVVFLFGGFLFFQVRHRWTRYWMSLLLVVPLYGLILVAAALMAMAAGWAGAK
jgi:hypothetical protein